MVCGQGGFHFGLVLRAVVEHLVLLAHQVADLCEQLFRGQPLQCRVGERGAADEIAAVDHVTLERSEATALVELGVGAALYHVALEVLQDLLVGLRPGDQPFDDFHRLAHVLAQARYLDPALVGSGAQAERAGDGVHLRCDLLGAHLVRSEVAQVVEGEVECRVVLRTRVEYVDQREDVVGFVFLIQHVDALLRLELRHVLLVVHEYRLDRLDLRVLYLGEELALRVAVGHDRRDLRGCDLLLVGVFAFTLVDDGITFGAEVFVGPVHDVLLGDLRHAVELLHFVGPVGAVDERVDVEHRAAFVLFERTHHLHLVIVDGRLDQAFVEIPVAQLGHFGQQHVAYFVERLPGLRAACYQERPVIGLRRCVAVCRKHLLLLVEVEVDQSGLAVIKYRAHDVRHVGRRVGRTRQAPSQHHIGGFQPVYFLHDGSRDRLFGLEVQLRQVGVRLHVAEVFFDRGDHFVGIEITRYADGHVVGHVVSLVVILDIGDRGVLQVFLCTQYGLRAVGMVGEQGGVHGLPDFAAVLRQGHVLLLVNSLQLGVEAADHGVLKPVGLDPGPVVDLVRRDVLDVYGHVLRRKSIGAVGADGRHQFVVLVRDGDFRSLVADRVDAVVDRRTLGLVGGLAVNFEEVFDLIEHRFLGCEVRCAELLRPLEHQVFEIVRQSGGLGRVVLAAHVHGDVGLDARRLLVDAHIDFQPVVQGVDFGVQRIALHCFVLVLRIRTSRGQHRCDDYRKE